MDTSRILFRKISLAILSIATVFIVVTYSSSRISQRSFSQQIFAQELSEGWPEETGFTGNADIEVESRTLSEAGPDAWLTFAGLLVTGMLGPIMVSLFKSRGERSEKNLNYAWENARDTQKMLVEAKDKNIAALMTDLENSRATIERLRAQVDKVQEDLSDAQRRSYEFEQQASSCGIELDKRKKSMLTDSEP